MKYLPSEIEINGVTYYSGLELASKQLDWYNLGLAAGKSESYDKGWTEGYKEGKERRSPYLVAPVSEYPNPYNVGYEAGKKDEYMKGYCDGISKINLNTEPVEQTELSKEYDKGFTKGYEEGFEEGLNEGYEIGKKANGISNKEDYDKGYKVGYEAGKVDNPNYMRVYQAGRNDGFDECKRDSISAKEIPGEYLAHIEEAMKQGYADGYKDCREVANCREVAKMLNKYGIDEDGPCNDCKEEPGRDEDGPEHPEYDKGYYAGWEDGKNHIMQFIGNESSR